MKIPPLQLSKNSQMYGGKQNKIDFDFRNILEKSY